MTLTVLVSRAIARRYAHALHTVAQAEGRIETVSASLNAVAQAHHSCDTWRRLAHAPVVNAREKTRAARALAAHLGCPEPLKATLVQMARHNRLMLVPALKQAFDARMRQDRGEQLVTLISARALTPEECSSLNRALARSLGKTPVLKQETNPDLLGGLIVQVGSSQLDASVKGRLAQARQRMYESVDKLAS